MIEKYLGMLTAVSYSGSIASLRSCPWSLARHLTLLVKEEKSTDEDGEEVESALFSSGNEWAMMGFNRWSPRLANCTQLVIFNPNSAVLLPFDWVTQALTACPQLSWLEIDWTGQDLRSKFIAAFRVLPERLRSLEVIIGGRYNEYESEGGFYMFRGWKTPVALQRVLELQEGAATKDGVKGRRQRCYIALLQKMLGNEEWGKVLEKETDMVKVLNWMTGEEGRCTGQIRATANCYAWFNCHDCKYNGMSGLCFHCATVCHQDHSTIFQYVSSGAYCDCTKCPKASRGDNRQEGDGDASSDDQMGGLFG